MSILERVTLPPGQQGRWRVEKFEIDKMDAAIAAFSYRGRAPRPGSYTRLLRGSTCVMSDTDAEMRDHMEPVWRASGHVLLNGLGIGMVLAACLRKPEVTHATVIEIDPDVIALVGPHYACDRLTIIQHDAMTYKPPKGVRYGMVWHDIWDGICGDNLPAMHALHRKYGHRCEWQGSWCRAQCERAK